MPRLQTLWKYNPGDNVRKISHISIWECGQPYSQDEKLYLNLKEFRGEFFEKMNLLPI